MDVIKLQKGINIIVQLYYESKNDINMGYLYCSYGSEKPGKNIKPDPNGEPWIVGEMPPLTYEGKMELEKIPELKITEKVELPYKLDNSTTKYFRAIFNQLGNSCSQASGVGYIYTYEMNFERGTAANDASRRYAYHYTWNFINDGQDVGYWYFNGWDLIKENGVPSQEDLNYDACTSKTWMSGYDKYYRAMHN